MKDKAFPKFKQFHYIIKSVSDGLPDKIVHKGVIHTFNTALLRIALELKGKSIVCVRIMRTLDVDRDKLWMCQYGMPRPNRQVLDEFYYSN